MRTKIAFTVICLLSLGGMTLQAQVNTDELIGYWRQNSLLNKQISNSEKQKRYLFTKDSLSFYSLGLNLSGLYTLDSTAKWIDWHVYVQGKNSVLPIFIKQVNRDTMYVWEAGKNPIIGVLVKISEKSVHLYQKGLDAQKSKDFQLMFSAFLKSAHYGHHDAMYQLGMCYFTGTGTLLDEEKGSQWIRAAADLGQQEAEAILGSLRY